MRAYISYTERHAVTAPPIGGIEADKPVEGYYRFRLVRGGVRGVVKIWFGPPHDPVTGEELDRGWRWQALLDGEPIDFDRVWPVCAGDPVTDAEYERSCARRRWAEQHAPDSAYAAPTRRLDPLSTDTPLPF